MKVWRMAFKWGSQGDNQWENCKEKNVAAIGYYSDYEPIVGDCSQISEEEYNRIWKESDINAKASQGSLKKFVYKMEKDDIIYAKDGPLIVGKGKVISEYKFERDGILDEVPWEHYREVEWEENFNEFKLVLGADQHTVLELNGDRLNKILVGYKKYNGK